MRVRLFRLLLLLKISLSGTVWAHIIFNYNGDAAGGGSGCEPGDVKMSYSADSITVSVNGFYAMPSGTEKTVRKACRALIPIKVERGWYISNVEQTVQYNYTRSSATDGKVLVATEVYPNASVSLENSIPTPGHDSFRARVSDTQKKQILPSLESCQGAEFAGIVKVNMVLSAYREQLSDNINVCAIQPFATIKFHTAKCP